MVNKGLRVFFIIWFGQFISLIGSGLTGFALGVMVYLCTGSVTKFSLIMLSNTVPGIVMSPFAGALVDRWDRRKAMILSDSGAAISTLAIAVLLYTDRLEIWHIYIATAFSSTFSSFQWPAYSAATTLLVPKKHLARAAGMVQTAHAASRILSPLMAGALLMFIQVWGVIMLDFVTFLFALFTLLMVRVPKPEATAEVKKGKGSLLREATFGWTYIKSKPGLLGLLIFFSAINFIEGFADVLYTPLILSFASPAMLGTILSVGGIGMFVGSLFLGVWGGPKRKVNGVVGFSLITGAVVAIAGLRASSLLLAAMLFMISFTCPVMNGCSQAIWQVKTAPDIQGRVFAIRRMIVWSTLPITYISAGPLADRVFEPSLAVNGPLADSIGRIIGIGPGRGIGLMFVVIGALIVIITVVSYMYPRLRLLEDELPDVVGEKPPDLESKDVCSISKDTCG